MRTASNRATAEMKTAKAPAFRPLATATPEPGFTFGPREAWFGPVTSDSLQVPGQE